MNQRVVLKRLIKVIADEICFLDRGYGYDKPKALEQEYQELQAALKWVESQVNQLNDKEYADESI